MAKTIETVKVKLTLPPFRLAISKAICIFGPYVVPYWWHDLVCKALAQWVVRGAKFEVE